jgi:amidase
MHVVDATQITFAFRPDAEPVLRIAPGETVRFETSDAPVEKLFAAGDDWVAASDTRAINAISGPVFIEGAMPGDVVSVEILAIEPRDWAWNAFLPGFGPLEGLMAKPMLERLPIRDGEVILSERLRVPVRPMIGCLGLAPASGETSTLSPSMPWAGNYDLTQIAPGATVLFPVQVPGGLFSLGDLHAAMGENEGASIALECPGSATVRLDVRKGLNLETPRIETAGRRYVMGIAPRGEYFAARIQAIRLLFEMLTNEAGLTPREAHLYLSARGDIALGGPAGMIVLGSVPWTEVMGDGVIG